MNLKNALLAILNDSVGVTLVPNKDMKMLTITTTDHVSLQTDTKQFTEDELNAADDDLTLSQLFASKTSADNLGKDSADAGHSDGEDTEEV